MTLHASLQMILLLVSGFAVAPRGASADDKDTARAQFEIGKQHYKSEAYTLAAEAFEASVLRYPTVSAYFNLANARFAEGEYDKAVRAAEEMQRHFGDEIPKIMREKTEELLQRIDKAAALLEIHTTPEGASVFVNDRNVSPEGSPAVIRIAPGNTAVRVEKSGWKTADREVMLTAGTKTALHIVLSELPSPPEPVVSTATEGETPPSAEPKVPQETVAPPDLDTSPAIAKESGRLSTASIVSLSTTAVLGVATGAFAGTAEKYYTDAEKSGQTYRTETDPDSAAALRADWQDAVDRHELFKYLTIGFAAAAGVAAITTTVLIVRDLRRSEKRPEAAVEISLAVGGIRGSF